MFGILAVNAPIDTKKKIIDSMLLTINEKGDIVLLTRQHPKGGPVLKGYPLMEDPETGMWGYKVGYCPCGCGQPLLIRTVDVRDIVNRFGTTLEEYKRWTAKLKPKTPLKHRMIRFLGGRVED